MSRDCCVALPRAAIGLSAVYNCGISWSYSLFLVAIFRSGPEVIKLASYSIQLCTKLTLLINVKMPTIFGILTFIIMIKTISERLKYLSVF